MLCRRAEPARNRELQNRVYGGTGSLSGGNQAGGDDIGIHLEAIFDEPLL